MKSRGYIRRREKTKNNKKGGKTNMKKTKKNLSTWTSKRLPHVCTIHARGGLTSLYGWEVVRSSGYGRDNFGGKKLLYKVLK